MKLFAEPVLVNDCHVVARSQCLPLDLPAEVHLWSDRASIAYRKWLKQLGITFSVID